MPSKGLSAHSVSSPSLLQVSQVRHTLHFRLKLASIATLQKHYAINHPKQLQEQEIELLRSQVGALMESKDLLKEELARIKSQSEDERFRIMNQMKERESEFFEQLKSEKRLREQFLKDQVEHNLISLAEDTQRLSPVPSASVPCSDVEPLRKVTVSEKETLTEDLTANGDSESVNLEITRLESELKISNDTCEKLRRDIDKLKDAYIKLKKELNDERSDQINLKEGNEGFLKEINKLQSDIHNLMDESETLVTEKNNIIKVLSEKIGAKENELESLRKANENHVAEITEKLTSDLHKLRSQFAEEKESLSSKVEEVTSQVKDLEEALNAKTTECRNMEFSLTEMTDKLAELRQEYKESSLKNESKSKSLRELADTARKRSDQLTTLKFDLEMKLKESLDTIQLEREKNESLSDELSRVKSEMDEMKHKHDEILHALHELGREHSSLQVQGEKLKSKIWVDDEAVKGCTRCSKPFSVTTRKHHCRSCFNIFCADCSPLRRSDGSVASPSSLGAAASLFKGSVVGGTRICEDCFGQSPSKTS